MFLYSKKSLPGDTIRYRLLILLISSLYGQLVFASPRQPTPPLAAEGCIVCHGSGNIAQQQAYPKLDGQHADYIVNQILDFQAGRRKDPVMSPIAKKLDQQSLKTIARYFEQQPVITRRKQNSSRSIRGHVLYIEHRCYMCHHPKSRNKASVLPRGPVIAGQRRGYLIKAMMDIKSNKRPADIFDLMHRIFGEVSDADIEAMAEHISTHSITELQQ